MFQFDYVLIQEIFRNCSKTAISFPEADINRDHKTVLEKAGKVEKFKQKYRIRKLRL